MTAGITVSFIYLLINTCREIGGAYGSGARNSNGIFLYMSYRWLFWDEWTM